MDKPKQAGTKGDDRVLQGEVIQVAEKADKPVAKRRRDGTFLPGPNPDRQVGRKPGSKNKVTLLRLELEESLRHELKGEGLEILRRAIEMAKQGNEKVIKVLLDKMLASPKGDDSESVKDNDVRITIQNLTHGEQTTQVAAIPHKKESDT